MTLSPRVTRVRANNPSPMTLDGTNAYVVAVGADALVAIDPGPDDPAQTAALLRVAHERRARYAAIVVTHGHPDHVPGAAPLAAATGAPVLAHPAAAFAHDRALADGDRLAYDGTALVALHAPGHARDHLVLVLEDERALFTGDVVLGTGTVVIAPPGGDMRAYQRTLHRLRDAYGDARALYGGHGPEVRDVRGKLDAYIAHREEREREIRAALAAGAATLPELVATVYAATDRVLWPAAARQVLAYLEALEREGVVRAQTLSRTPTPAERAILEPDLSRLGDGDSRVAATVRAELGYAATPPLQRYAIVSTTLPN